MGWWINTSKKIFTRSHFTTYNQLPAIVKEHNCYGIYRTVYLYNNQDANKSYLYGDIYFDFDSINDFDKARNDAIKTLAYFDIIFKIKPENVNIYFSGSKGIHITIPASYFNVKPCKNLNQIYKYIATNVNKYTTYKTLDLTIYDNKRLFRIPNTIHEKSGLYKIPITYDELRNLSHTQLKELAKQPRSIKKELLINNSVAVHEYQKVLEGFETYIKTLNTNVQYKATLKITPPCIKTLLQEGAKNGYRNNSIAILASFCKSKGMDLNTSLKKIAEWNQTKNTPPTKEAELTKTVRSIFNSKASYGCSMIKTIIDCDEKNCKLKKGKNNNARK